MEAKLLSLKKIFVPDIGEFKDVEIIELFVAEGDVVEQESTLITLETDKAAMEIPCPFNGKVKELKVDIGDKVSKGSLILILETEAEGAVEVAKPAVQAEQTELVQQSSDKPQENIAKQAQASTDKNANALISSDKEVYASPAVRRLARELSIDLTSIQGSGRKGRISREDLINIAKSSMQGQASTGAPTVPAMPEIDFSQYGKIEAKPLPRIKKLTAQNLHRNWAVIPHVTHFDEADITEMEAFRQSKKQEAADTGYRLTPLVFLMKAVVSALKEFPQFNASLASSMQEIIYKKYFHIGVAVDTPNGLVVPVVKDVDQKGLMQLAMELSEISAKARKSALTAKEMQGSCFTISSLGGIGGVGFTPIINAPDVAILGVSKAQQKPVYIDGRFVPRLQLPLALSYDHRVIDGAEAARFSKHLVTTLTDIRSLLL